MHYMNIKHGHVHLRPECVIGIDYGKGKDRVAYNIGLPPSPFTMRGHKIHYQYRADVDGLEFIHEATNMRARYSRLGNGDQLMDMAEAFVRDVERKQRAQQQQEIQRMQSMLGLGNALGAGLLGGPMHDPGYQFGLQPPSREEHLALLYGGPQQNSQVQAANNTADDNRKRSILLLTNRGRNAA